jgi:hypothetical protein
VNGSFRTTSTINATLANVSTANVVYYNTTNGLLTHGALTASINNITDIPRIFNNSGDPHSTRTSFDSTTASINFGWRYVQGNTNGPAVNSAAQYYSLYVGLGDQYPATGVGSYGMQIAFPRNVTNPYLAIRYNENNALGTWQKISAAYADSAGTAVSLTTARTLTIGNTGKTFNGTANVSWTLAEIGAVSGSGTTNYIPKWTSSTAIGDSTIFDNGNVGIGLTNPFAKLHVNGTLAIGHPSYPGLIFSNADTGEFRIDNRSSAASGYITFFPNGENATVGNEAMRILANRNVLIGTTTNSGHKLDVNGTIAATQYRAAGQAGITISVPTGAGQTLNFTGGILTSVT